jgi:putative peptide zinc metalloprotease protein
MSATEDIAAAPPAVEPEAPPQLAHGIELIGEFEGSGFKVPPNLARRADGQVVQLTPLLYLVAEACDGRRDAEAIGDLVSEQYGKRVTGENVEFLAEEKLRPLGVLALADGTTPELEQRAPLLALRHRKAVLPEPAVNRAAGLLTWLHAPLVQIPLLLAIAAFDVWLFGIHGVAGGMRSAIYSPALLLGVLASVVVATAFHELGHASACRSGGARPGVMGVGVYLVWPAFYCDVTDAYRLNRIGRLRTDLGGVYFNAIFALLAGGVYFATGEEGVLLAASVQYVIILQQLLPLLRFDGYYVLSDLTGVPDILSRIRPIFRSLLRPRRAEPAVAELKPWVRAVVTIYLIVLVPELTLLVVSMVMGAPRMLATTYDSLGLQIDRLHAASGPAELGLGGFQILALVMPVAAMSVSLGRTGRRAGRGMFRWASVSRARAALAATGTVAALAAVTYVLLPNGDYEPIRPGERGTIGQAVKGLPTATGGRPSFTPGHARQFAPVPTERQQRTPIQERRQTEQGTAPTEEKGTVGSSKPAKHDRPASASPAPAETAPAASDPASTPTPTSTPAETATPTPTPTVTPTPTDTATPAPTEAAADPA